VSRGFCPTVPRRLSGICRPPRSLTRLWRTAVAPARSVAESFHRIEAGFLSQFILGIGAGHRENENDYRKLYQALVDELDELDDAGVPRERRAMAALGPRVLELARVG
jgi:hypothetical protein